jgi:adenosylcobinamide kinase/adenosylcobinamide-phosphate guanylyltransferase
MVVLIAGPNGSGKSRYAENLVAGHISAVSAGSGDGAGDEAGAPHTCAPYYIATMIPYGGEGAARVEKHRKQRESSGFITVEEPYGVSGIPLPPDSAVLLEDVTNLLANNMFGERRINGNIADSNGGGYNCAPDADCAERDVCLSVFEDISGMCSGCGFAALVTINGLTASEEYDAETRGYVDGINRLNGLLAEYSGVVVTMENGVPTVVKGDLDAQA